MTTTTFDTLQFAKDLADDGYPEEQAKAMAREDARRRAADDEREKELVTKGYLKGELSDLRFDLLKWAVALLVGFYVAISVTNTGSMYATLKLLLPSVL